jgi:hypothetical protein
MSPSRRREGTAMPEDDFSPCKLNEYKGRFSLLFVAFDEAFVRLAVTYGGQGGGYSLQAMVEAVADIEGIEMPGLTFDSEADMFVARGDKSALRIVAEIVRRVLGDRGLADKAIVHSRERGHFD